jgi:hypothetical protein
MEVAASRRLWRFSYISGNTFFEGLMCPVGRRPREERSEVVK